MQAAFEALLAHRFETNAPSDWIFKIFCGEKRWNLK